MPEERRRKKGAMYSRRGCPGEPRAGQGTCDGNIHVGIAAVSGL